MSLLKHRTLSGALLEEMRQAILSGRYPGGSQLRQDALAESFGVSRIPIREVLLQLEAEGLVQIQPRRGAVVTSLSLDEIEDVFDLRAILESRLYLRSAPRLTREDLAAVAAVQARYVAAIAARELARFGELNAELHMALYARAGLPRSHQMLAALLTTSERYTRMQLTNPEAMARAIAEHDALIRLTRDGAFEEANRLLVAHIGTVRADLVRALGRTAPPPSAPPPSGPPPSA